MFGYCVSVPNGACGVGVISDFTSTNHNPFKPSESGKIIHEGGADLLLVGFINTKICEKVYNHLIKTYPLLLQTSVRRNNNTNNQFFACVFDTTGTPAGFRAVDEYISRFK